MPPESPLASPRQRLRRLPGRSPSLRWSRATASARLWMDAGQLIQESVRSYTQEIQRFAFADIQAIQIRRTVRGMVYGLILAGLLFVLLLITIFADDSLRVRLICGASFGAPLAILLLINTLRGPTCRTVLTTALGPQHLPSLSRMPSARRALDAIIANTEAVQGTMRPEEAAQQVDRVQAGQR